MIIFIRLKRKTIFVFYRNLVGITIHAQRQLEFERVERACDYNYQDEEEDEIIEQYTKYQLQKPQSDVWSM